ASGREGMTVAEIDALLYLPNRSRRDLARALRIPALSEGWKGSLPGAARPGTCTAGRRTGQERAPDLDRIPGTAGAVDRAREPRGDLDHPDGGGLRTGPGGFAGSVPDHPAAPRSVRIAPDPELLAVWSPRRRQLSHRRKA